MSGESHKVEITDNYEGMQRQIQASTSHNGVRLDIEDMKLLTALRQKTEVIKEEKKKPKVSPNEENITKIQRAPTSMLQNLNEEYFQPAELSVGFIQNSNEEYFKPKKLSIGFIHAAYRHRELKLQLAAHFILESGCEEEAIFKEFKSNMKDKDIKECFDEKIVKLYINDNQLIRLLFLDGCAILGFIHGHVNRRLKVVGISDAEAADIERDLVLLENQIPFRVLQVLIDAGRDQGKENLKGSLVIFIYLICRGTFPGHSPEDLHEYLKKYCFSPERNKNSKAVHLLDVFREALLFNPPFNLFGLLPTVIRGTCWILCSCGCLAISYFLERFKPEPHYNIISLFRTAKEFFFTVHELKAAGIKFKPSQSLKTVSFRYLFFFRAQLMLPTLIVDDSMASKLVNLVAYEMCLSVSHPNRKPWVASYVNLLDLLINDEQDVKDLIEAEILQNFLNRDIAVADLIKLIGSKGFTPHIDAYVGVKLKLEKHYKKKWRRKCAIWIEQVYVDHFNSPWTILALFATATALILTAIQTWYAINPKK